MRINRLHICAMSSRHGRRYFVKLDINPEFQARIPSLTAQEFKQLEHNLLTDGCREPLVVWNGTIVDGHNRYAICQKHHLGFETTELAFANREVAMDWIDANQLGRRNLNPDQASILRGRRYNRMKKQHGGDRRSEDISSGQHVLLKTAETLAQQHGVNERTIRRDGKLAEAFDKLQEEAPEQARAVMAGEKRFNEATGAHVSYNSGQNEWYTPTAIIELARNVMGSIDCDPASSPIANQRVKAGVYYTSEDDGLHKPWIGNVWLNPPYAPPMIGQFITKLMEERDGGEIREACVLVNNATETEWCHSLWLDATAVFFPKGRIRFLDPEGNPGAPLQGQLLCYFGDNGHRLYELCHEWGKVWFPREAGGDT
jgi:ParB family chromosome partitioning protein